MVTICRHSAPQKDSDPITVRVIDYVVTSHDERVQPLANGRGPIAPQGFGQLTAPATRHPVP